MELPINYENIQVEDPNAMPTEGGTVKELVMRQLSRCVTEGSKEMDGGGIRKRIVQGQLVEIGVPNQREIFINSVEMLYFILEPYLKNDKAVIKKVGKLFDNFDKNKDGICLEYQKNLTNAQNRANFITANARGWVKDDSKGVYGEESQKARENYELKLVDLYKKRLQALSFLLDELDYFSNVGF